MMLINTDECISNITSQQNHIGKILFFTSWINKVLVNDTNMQDHIETLKDRFLIRERRLYDNILI